MALTIMSALKLNIEDATSGKFKLSLQCELPGTGVTAIYGPSGSGKTTLLNCIAGLRTPLGNSSISLGNVNWQGPGEFVEPWRRGIGYVFQDARLFPHLNVRENLLYAVKRQQRSAAVTLEQATDWLALNELLAQMPDTLSAGQKQRVAIARALLCAPQLLLLDEPLANLDHQASQECLQYLQALTTRLRLPMLYVSHDIEEVSQIAEHLLLLDNGTVQDQGSLLELSSRLDSRLSQEEQAAAIITAPVALHDDNFGLTQLSLDGQVLWVNQLADDTGIMRRVRIPARDVSICRSKPNDSSILNILRVTISEIQESDTTRLMLRLSLGSQFLLARITRKSASELKLQVGDAVFAQIKSVALLMEAVSKP
ncbi:MAG: molybdate transport system ATP-binding protein [Bacteroidia bacterium]|jgi:molybdate transport system ATP-binding protein